LPRAGEGFISAKDGKEHRYFSVVENKRVAAGRIVQRHVLYLGEINDMQALAWRKSIEVFDDGVAGRRRCRCFPRILAKDCSRMPR
jgi:hypothetical protein